MTKNSDVLNGKEAAEFLQSNYYNLMRKARKGKIPSFKFGGKVLFRRSTLETWITNKEKQSVEEVKGNV